MKKSLILILISMFLVSAVAMAHESEEVDCSNLAIDSHNTADFLEEVPDMDEHLQACKPRLIKTLRILMGNKKMMLEIQKDDSTQNVLLKVEDGKLSELNLVDNEDADFKLSISECRLDSVLDNGDVIGTMAYLYKNKRVTLEANGFGNKVKLILLRPFIKMGMKKFQVPIDLDC